MSQTSCSSGSSSSISFESESSTVVYDHETFDTFKVKARSLLASQFPDDLPITVNRMRGGSFHRILKITLKHGIHGEEHDAVLRIPRYPYVKLADEVAVLRYLIENTDIPVPRVLCFDSSSENAIGDPYVVQTRLAGVSLNVTYAGFPLEKKLIVIRDVARLIKKFSEVTFSVIGMLVKDDTDSENVKMDQGWDYMEDIFPREEGNPRPLAQSNSILGFLEERWSFHLEEEQRCSPQSRSEIAYIAAFRDLQSKLSLPSKDTRARIVLFHTDFTPRNLFVDQSTGEITGVLDWDGAESAVVEAAWTMPAWLWDSECYEHDLLEWVDPDQIPSDPIKARLREAFIYEIGQLIPDYVEVVRSNRVLHELLLFARLGLRSQTLIERADRFLKGIGIPIPNANY